MIPNIEEQLIIRKFLTELDRLMYMFEPDCSYEECLPRLRSSLVSLFGRASTEELLVITKMLLVLQPNTTLTTVNRVIPYWIDKLCQKKKK